MRVISDSSVDQSFKNLAMENSSNSKLINLLKVCAN